MLIATEPDLSAARNVDGSMSIAARRIIIGHHYHTVVSEENMAVNNPFPKDSPFGNFVRSDTPENIFYADLFQMNGRNWMIQGYGKTNAARIATGKNSDFMYATDSVALIRKGDTLWGRYDLGASSNYDSELNKFHKLDAITYCLSEAQTIKAFAPTGGKREIVDVDYEVLSALCATYPYPASLAFHFFTQEEAEHFANPMRMTERFVELAKDTVGTKFLLIPYMPLVEEKAALYINFAFLP